MRSIIYAAYSKDLSVKTTTAKIQMMKQGKYVGGYAPYGYVLHPEIRNKLKLDPEAAEVVRRVFDEALEGRNTSQIALSLNDDNISTPGQYFKDKHPDKKKYSRMSEKISWTASMVYKILTSYVYTGATVGHKRKSGGVGSRKTISQKKEDWIIVEGMHEAIVSKEEFELAQAVIRGGEKNPKRNLRYYPLKGLVCCGNCKRALTRRKLRNESGYFYQCTHSTHDRDTDCPVGERYSEAWIEDTAYPPAPRGADAISPFSEMGYAAANTRKYTDMFRAGEIDPSVPGQAICLEAYKESEMFYLSLINRLDQK